MFGKKKTETPTVRKARSVLARDQAKYGDSSPSRTGEVLGSQFIAQRPDWDNLQDDEIAWRHRHERPRKSSEGE
ncbi:hypothetical protein [Streptomyces sp. URMC 129]|uniref:hypothetical protein n=1 Tax=Streptomyces sp. URMC 129 TaxID=3423407 RepID=UPI003F1B57E1